ncbi:MAG: hypothetical protein PHS34_09380, partial [Candidatus Omnitrophica bacterium]|nr:hypothetical protein [Candidatus Omnitrophota bacterium]
MDTNFETGRNSVLLIPSLAKSCSAPGCEEFTNLDEVAKGGEGIEYYSYIRTCQKPDTQTCGYYYTWVGSDTNGYQLKKYYLQKTDSASNEPAATNMVIPADWGTCLNAQDAIDHPHCKEFYAADGTPYYKFYESTITCSDDCHSLRRTTGAQIYQAIPDESITCSKANVGCREYKGNAASNVRQILNSDFEDGTNQSWIGGENSNNSVTYLGHSMKITSEVKAIEHTASGLVTQGKSYIISFWAKGRGTWSAAFSAANKDPLYIGSTLSSNEDWREIKLGPVYFNREVGSDEKLIISPALQNSYIDNIILKEVKDDLNLIKDSWKTKMPAECVVPGCQAYKDQNNKFQYLTSFARLCDEKSVGCEALIDTQNSASPFAETFKNGTTVPADNLIYLINDSKKSCQETNKGCQKFGLPTLSAEQTVVGWSDLYLKNNPDNYTSKPILCDSVNTGCEEYNLNGSGGSVYFKDPGENLCEWREKIMVGGENKTGWFTKGTDQPCYYNSDNTPYQVDGTYGIKINTEANYKNIAGICPQKQTGCTQFTDSSAAAGSQNYYYLNDGKLDQSSCQGMVSQKQGCVLLSDNSLKNANGAISTSYNTLATYEKSKANNYGLVAPIDCSGDKCKDSIDSCQSECFPGLIGEICRAACVTKYINDANVILKVAQDRTCGEWLTCTSSRSEWDKTSGSYKDICEAVGRCDKLVGTGDANQCGHLIWETDPKILAADVYQNRDISWSGMDYSGHSIYNMYPIERLWAKEYKDGYRLTYMIGKDDQGAGKNSKGELITIAKTCRAYPEKDSPFKNGTDASYFSGVNVCSDQGGNGDNKDCQCSYIKLENQGKGILKYCNSDNEEDCKSTEGDTSGDKITNAIGLRGFCLEPDPSKPTDLNACITWWPGKAIGDPDIYNQFQSAGYVAPAGKEWYCTEKNEGKELVILSADYSRWCCSEKGNSSKTCSISSIPSEFKNITLEKIEKITAETGGDAGGPGANCGGYDKGDWPWEWGDLTNSGNYYYLQRDSTDGYGMIKVYFTNDSPNATID